MAVIQQSWMREGYECLVGSGFCAARVTKVSFSLDKRKGRRSTRTRTRTYEVGGLDAETDNLLNSLSGDMTGD
jgi:hypothetical protein